MNRHDEKGIYKRQEEKMLKKGRKDMSENKERHEGKCKKNLLVKDMKLVKIEQAGRRNDSDKGWEKDDDENGRSIKTLKSNMRNEIRKMTLEIYGRRGREREIKERMIIKKVNRELYVMKTE